GVGLKKNKEVLAKKNWQLLSLFILTDTYRREHLELYAPAEETYALIRSCIIYTSDAVDDVLTV
ncbi:hypothetical protein ACVGWA_16390, partial [Enterobacter hormaechei]